MAVGNRKVSMITDDFASTNPWRPRDIRVNGTARTIQGEEKSDPASYLEITPTVSWSWGIEDRQDFKDGRFTPKRTAWRGAPQ